MELKPRPHCKSCGHVWTIHTPLIRMPTLDSTNPMKYDMGKAGEGKCSSPLCGCQALVFDSKRYKNRRKFEGRLPGV